MPQVSVGAPLLWVGSLLLVLAMLAVDLGIFHRKSRAVSLKEAAVGMAKVLNMTTNTKMLSRASAFSSG